MKKYSYEERDYAFGQLVLTLRTTIGLSQAALGELLGVSRRAVAEWEGGLSYPKAERLKQLITLGMRASAFACIGYLAHPFKKRRTWPARSLLSLGTELD